jgi:DNA-binding NarL/FixJ family response regulator
MNDSERASRQVGRQALLDAVLADLRADPRGKPVLVTGPRGSGRRTFAASVAQRARRAGLTLHRISVQRVPSDGDDPNPASDIGEPDTAEPDTAVPDTAVPDSAVPDSAEPDTGPWPAWLDREADQVLAMSRRSPVVVVLDDLDHKAEAQLERCALLVRRLTGHPVRVVLTVRVPEWGVADGRPLTRLAAVSTRHRLEPLDDDGVRVLATEYTPTPLSPELIAALGERLGFAHGRPGPLRSLLAVITAQDLTTTVEGHLHPWVALFGLDHPEMANLAYAADRLGPLPARVLRRIGSLGSITSADTGATLDALCTNGILIQDRQAQVRSAVPALTGAVRPDSPAGLITRLVAEHLIDDFMVGRSQDVAILARAMLASEEATPGEGCLELSQPDRELLASLTDPDLARTPQAETFIQDLLHPDRSVQDPVAMDLLAPASVRAVQRGDLAQAERLCAQYAERATAVTTQPERDLLVQDVRRAVTQARGVPNLPGPVVPDPLLRTPAAVRYEEARKAWNGGDWDAVVALAVQGVVRTGWEDPDLHTVGLRALGAEVLSQRGQQSRAVDLLEPADLVNDSCGWPSDPVRCVTTWAALRISLGRGSAEQALRGLARALAKVDTQDLPDDADLLLERMVDVALSLGDVGAAGDAPQTLGALARADGSRARMLDRYVHAWLRTDVVCADEAVAFADDDGSPYWRAVTRLRTARLGNQDPAVLEEAHRLFTRLGLPGWRAQAASLMRERSITVPRTRRPSANDSADRATLVELVIAGLTNRQIAGRLCVSEKTVERRLSAVLASEGCRSRVELAALHAKSS